MKNCYGETSKGLTLGNARRDSGTAFPTQTDLAVNDMSTDNSKREFVSEEGYHQAIDVLRRCCTEHGFLATPTEQDNYRRIWGRDSGIIGLAALLSGDNELIDACRCSIETLAQNQGPHGEIPSNVDPASRRVSYGGTVGRVDSSLWFVIVCGVYWRMTGDDEFLEQMLKPLQRVRELLGAWEFNARGLLYVPPTGDWADEYLQSGYVLYDQLLYLQAQREFCAIHQHFHQTTDHRLDERVARLKHLIRANYWFAEDEEIPDDVYHEVLYRKGHKAAPHRGGSYWMPFFSPLGYGYRFDALANSLAMLLNVANDSQCKAVDDYIDDQIVHDQVMLLPAFHPVITPQDEKWDELQMTFSYTFKNSPYEYQNGGLWPMVTGFYAASLAKRGNTLLSRKYCEGIHAANKKNQNGYSWSFPEYIHGKNYRPEGTSPMGWSAAASVIVEEYLKGKHLFEGTT